MKWIHAITAALALFAASCATPQQAQTPATLIVVSLDGFRADYLDRGLTPTISALAADGVRARVGMRPSFPSVTMPNHYTLMTGLRPDHHGIVDNTMFAPDIPGWFGGPDRSVFRDVRWWNQATPLWVSAERQGVRTGGMMWAGTEFPIQGVPLSQVQPYNPAMNMDARVDGVLGWLDLPAATRPRFIALYMSPVDEAGHAFGPSSPEVNAALGVVDGALARLVAGLRARGMADNTNLVIVADHGMMDVSVSRVVIIDDFVDTSKLVATTYGAEIGVNPLPGHEPEVSAAMLAPHPHLTCWRKADIPARLHYGSHARVPQIFCLAEPGWLVVTRAIGAIAQLQYPQGIKGNHGYDPAVPEMAALFVVHGPAFRQGIVVEPFDNVDVYPMLARVLGVTPERNDGSHATLAPALR